jgi:hypothetical protein
MVPYSYKIDYASVSVYTHPGKAWNRRMSHGGSGAEEGIP